MRKFQWLLLLLLGLPWLAWAQSPDQNFEGRVQEFLDTYLRHNPELATGLGEHRYDGLWSDLSPEAHQSLVADYQRRLQELEAISGETLSPGHRVDRAILSHHLQAQLWSWQQLEEWQWNPLLYNPGPALYALIARDFAPPEVRLTSLAQRLERLPAWLAQVRLLLDNPPALHTQVAIEQNQGVVAFLETGLDQAIPAGSPRLQARLRAARESALQALGQHGLWLQQHLLPRSRRDYRLGPEKFRRKLLYTLESTLEPEELRRRAEADLKATQAAMAQVARPLYQRYGGDAASLSDAAVNRAVISRLAEDHPDSSNIVARAAQSLERARQFVAERKLVSLPSQSCQVIEMPEFNRGVAVAYCDSPGPLESGGATFYAIAPTPLDWSAERSLSFYREYNHAMLDNLTVHEAMPGHFLQLMHANGARGGTQLRAVLQSGTFVEGWATYAEQLMVAQGYGGPELAMMQLKMRLRLILNALLDQRVHCGQAEEKATVAWLMEQGYQEEGEAVGKWRRACLTSCQLSTYYLGNCEVNDLIAAYRQAHPQQSWLEVHDQVLSFGSVSARYLKELLNL